MLGACHVHVHDGGQRQRDFIVDEVLDSRLDGEASQSVFYDSVGASLVKQALQGYNVCVVAYGHTGSGKTFTMLGGGKAFVPRVRGEEMGLLPRFLRSTAVVRHSSEGS